MVNLVLRWVFNAALLLLITNIIPGVEFTGFYAALVTVAILGLINAFIRPIITLFTLPINLLTLGLFGLVINAVLFWFTATIVEGFSVENFTAAFLGALLFWLGASIISWVFK